MIRNIIHEYSRKEKKKSVLLAKHRGRILAELDRNCVKSIKYNGFQDVDFEREIHSLKENEDHNDVQVAKNC